MTLILIGIESSIITAMLIYQPADSMYDYSLYKRVILRCNTTTLGILGPFGFDFGLIALCTLYAIKTRNLPENFNEAKFIGFTMYTTCIVWLAFVTIYFGSDRKSITMCFCFSLSASVTLVLLFFPKIYIILLQPQKNVRSSYATSKVIRCHFGTTMSQASTVTQNSSRSKYVFIFILKNFSFFHFKNLFFFKFHKICDFFSSFLKIFSFHFFKFRFLDPILKVLFQKLKKNDSFFEK